MNNPISGLVGIAYRAGKIVSGYELSLQAIQKNKGKIVLIAKDASDNTKKTFFNKSKFYRVPIFEIETKEKLGRAIGKNSRSVLVCTDSGFAKALILRLNKK